MSSPDTHQQLEQLHKELEQLQFTYQTHLAVLREYFMVRMKGPRVKEYELLTKLKKLAFPFDGTYQNKLKELASCSPVVKYRTDRPLPPQNN